MAVYSGKPFALKVIGVCSTCPNETVTFRDGVKQWLPGVVRSVIYITGEESFIKTASVDMTFCPECIKKVDEEIDFPHLQDLIWKGWDRARKVAQMSDAEWEKKVHLYRGFKLLSFKAICKRVSDNWVWEDVLIEEVRSGGNPQV